MVNVSTPKTHYLKDYTPPTHVIDTITLRFELAEDNTIVTSTMRVRNNPLSKSKGHGLELNGSAKHITLVEIKIDDCLLTPADYVITEYTLTLKNVPGTCKVEIKTRLQPQNNTDLAGLYKSGKGVNEKFCTQCEAEGFRNITYYLDRPDVLSKFTTEIIADRKKYPYLLSNGNPLLEQTKDFPDDRTSVTWYDPFPKPSYLFALVAGDMDVVEDHFITLSGRKVKLQLFVDIGDTGKTAHAMASIKKAMQWDEERFGREYDLGLFQIVAVQDFNMGAMENKGLNIFNSALALANPETATDGAYFSIERVIAHEYFHNWTGDRVTCRDWFQLSLKEGLTVFRDQEFSGDIHSLTTQRIRDVAGLRSTQFPEDAGGMAHPIRPSSYISIDNFYTRTVYAKGAEVIRMMQTLIGKNTFRKGMDLYFERHDGQAVTTEDFVKCIEDASGNDLSQFERTWYNQAGTPTIAVTDDYDVTTQTYTLCVQQTTPQTPGQPHKDPFHIPLRVGLVDRVIGDDIELHMAPEQQDLLTATDVLNIKQTEQKFVFHNVNAKPIPSLLRNFSAPVKLEYNYSRQDLAFLMEHDSDGFNRWEAGQKLALDILQEMIAQNNIAQPMKADPLFIHSLHTVLGDTSLDKKMVASMLMLPSEDYVMEMIVGAVDPYAIHAARDGLRKIIGNALADDLEKAYERNRSADAYTFTTEGMARRSLKNIAMSYLSFAGNTSFAEKQFATQENMTDVSASLAALANSDNRGASEKALAAFYEKWKADTLVIDQWFSIQAGYENTGTVSKVTALMKHEAFDIKNPNKAKALLGVFASNNPNFHAVDGSGYRFYADEMIAYDKINKQVAARIVEPLTRWHKYDEPRAHQMRMELERIIETPHISENLYEIVSKSLAFTQSV